MNTKTTYSGTDHERLDKAIYLASIYHRGQTDKAGVPTIFHVMNVAYRCRKDPEEAVVALLHDLVEDTEVDLNQIRLIFGQYITEAVDALTNRENEPYTAYIDRLSRNPLAVEVKKADLLDNMDPARQDFEGSQELFAKHLEAYQKLTGWREEEFEDVDLDVEEPRKAGFGYVYLSLFLAFIAVLLTIGSFVSLSSQIKHVASEQSATTATVGELVDHVGKTEGIVGVHQKYLAMILQVFAEAQAEAEENRGAAAGKAEQRAERY